MEMNPIKWGGSRVRSGPQVNNTSMLLGIRFRWAHRKGTAHQPVIVVAVGDRRYTRGVLLAGVRNAMREALKLRRDAGLKVAGLERSIDAFNAWRKGWNR